MDRYLTDQPAAVHASFDVSQFDDLDLIGTIATIKTSGKSVMWAIGTGGSFEHCGPIVQGGTLYVGNCDHKFYALSLAGEKQWECATGAPIMCSAYIAGSRLYVGSMDKTLYCLTLDGKKDWKFSAGDSIGGRVAGAEGRIFFGCKDGCVYCLSTEGKLIWKFRTTAPISDDLLYHDGHLYVMPEEQNFYCLDALTGKVRWRFSAGGPFVFHRPVVLGNRIFVGATDNNFYCLDRASGKLAWKFPVRNHPRSAATDGERLYVLCRDQNIYALSLAGKLAWRFQGESIWILQPAIADGVIYAGNADGNLYAISCEGRLLWKYRTGGPVVATPVVLDGKVYFGSNDCTFYCVDVSGKLQWTFRSSLAYPSPIQADQLGPQQALEVVATMGEMPREEHGRYAVRTLGDGGSESVYTFKSEYTTKSLYTSKKR
ncbi:MAG: PQQ-binding-like beta-propeller repeat protein [Candidatus Aenigmarchaeota archaeon]|nr:PQQ-binding-like beta-propeller repeat protein [Candidatus Aenigmarchaeota archaeon]